MNNADGLKKSQLFRDKKRKQKNCESLLFPSPARCRNPNHKRIPPSYPETPGKRKELGALCPRHAATSTKPQARKRPSRSAWKGAAAAAATTRGAGTLQASLPRDASPRAAGPLAARWPAGRAPLQGSGGERTASGPPPPRPPPPLRSGDLRLRFPAARPRRSSLARPAGGGPPRGEGPLSPRRPQGHRRGSAGPAPAARRRGR